MRDARKFLVRNLVSGVKRDRAPDVSVIQRGEQQSGNAVMGTAHWGEDGIRWRWSSGGVEATAFVLRALLAIDPKHELVVPTVNWLVKNRRGAQWSNTRDTAMVVLAMTDYLRTSGELDADLTYEVLVDGKRIAENTVTPSDVLGVPNTIRVDPELIGETGATLAIRRTRGEGPLYFTVSGRFFSLEEPIQPAGNEIFVRREYFKLSRKRTLFKGYVFDRSPLLDGDTVASGERVEVVLTIEAKNNYEYLVFEDLKPAGLEAVQIKSGGNRYVRELNAGGIQSASTPDRARTAEQRQSDEQTQYTGRQRWVYEELRDRKVALFVDKLPEGVWEMRYTLRAEVPGKFHALPVLGHAMYVPEVRCNGAEVRVEVLERE